MGVISTKWNKYYIHDTINIDIQARIYLPMAIQSYILLIFLTWIINIMFSLQYIYNNAVVTPKFRGNIRKVGTVYYIKIVTPIITVYKLGYTTREVSARCRDFKLSSNCKVYLVDKLDNIPQDEVYVFEQILHTRCRNTYDSYYGKDILSSGNTELYRWDILKLDTKDRVIAEIVQQPKVVSSRIFCKCTRLQRAASPTAHVDTCPRYGMPLIL